MGVEFITNGDYTSMEEAVHSLPTMSGSRLYTLATCPRSYEIHYLKRLTRKTPNMKLIAGSALHRALEIYHSTEDPDVALKELKRSLAEEPEVVALALKDTRCSHLTASHLVGVFQQYVSKYGNDTTYEPLRFKLDELNLERVVAAEFVTEGDVILLGESTVLFDWSDENGDLYYLGRPDMPVLDHDTGLVYVMDHKTTSGYIGDYFFSKHRISNKLRAYAMMVQDLIGEVVHGGVVNAIYVGDRANNPKSNVTRFLRNKFDWDQSLLIEAVENFRAFSRLVEHYEREGYYPQGCFICSHPNLCGTPKVLRGSAERIHYTVRPEWGDDEDDEG